MIYTFTCEDCGSQRTINRSIHVGPPEMLCCGCGHAMHRDWQADEPMIDTSACRDHNFIPHHKRVASAYDRGSEEQIENGFRRHIENRRKVIRDAGGQRGSLKQTHAVPAHLFHGKIKETGDKNYWSDPKNLAKHNDCKVDG